MNFYVRVHRNYDKAKNIIAGQFNTYTGDKKIPRRYTFSAVCGLLAGGTLLVNGLHCQVLHSHSEYNGSDGNL